MKYLIATIILGFSLALGWFVSTKHLKPVILWAFNPASHEKYLDIWFSIFALIELAVVLAYLVYVYKIYKSNNHLIKSSNRR